MLHLPYQSPKRIFLLWIELFFQILILKQRFKWNCIKYRRCKKQFTCIATNNVNTWSNAFINSSLRVGVQFGLCRNRYLKRNIILSNYMVKSIRGNEPLANPTLSPYVIYNMHLKYNTKVFLYKSFNISWLLTFIFPYGELMLPRK